MADIASTAERGITRQSKRGPEGTAWLARADAEWARLRWLTGVDAPSADELVGSWERAVDGFELRPRVRTGPQPHPAGRGATGRR